MSETKEELIAQLHRLTDAVKRQSDRCMFAFQTFGRASVEQDAILKSLLRDWWHSVKRAKGQDLDVEKTLGTADYKLVVGLYHAYTEVRPAELPLNVYAFVEHGIDGTERAAKKHSQSAFGDGLSSMVGY